MLVTFLKTWHLIYFCLVSCFFSLYLMVLCGLLYFLYLQSQLVSCASDNDENIWMSKFCDISHDKILEGTIFLFQIPFIKESFPRGTLSCPKVCRGQQHRQIQDMSGPLSTASASQFPIIMRAWFNPRQPCLRCCPWCFAWLPFSQLSGYSGSQNAPVSSFLSCQQLPLPFHSVMIFQVLYSILWRLTHGESFMLWEKSWEENFMVQYATQREICPRQSNKQPDSDLRHRD